MRNQLTKRPLPKTILFDIDKTLFNTSQAGKALLDTIDHFLVEHHVSQFNAEEILESYLETLTKTSQFHFHNLLIFIENKLLSIDIELKWIHQLHRDLQNLIESNFLYVDSLSIVKKLKKNHWQLGVFSQSDDPSWQNMKIIRLQPYLNPDLIFISQDKTSTDFLTQLPREAIIIDDKPVVVEVLLTFAQKHKRDWRLFLIDRHGVVDNKTKEVLNAQGVMIIENLKTLVNFF